MKIYVNGVEKTMVEGMPLTWDGAVVLSGRDRAGDNLVTYHCDGEPEQWIARGHAVIVKEGMRIQVKDVPAVVKEEA